VVLHRTASVRLGKDVLDVEDVTYSVAREGAARRVLLDHVTWRLGPGDRVGVVGANGSGKTTLLRLLAGELQPDSGRVRRGKTVQLAVLSQSLRELDEVAHLRVLEAVERERRTIEVDGREVTASQLVERLGFTRERAWTPVAELSGGERRRLQLARLLVHSPNVLMLDEPTNDLDTDTLTAVEDVLDGFGGTLVVVSHDRYLLERVCDTQVAMLGDGAVRGLPGGVEQYLELRSARTRAREEAASRPGGVGSAQEPGGPATPEGPSAADVRSARKEMARVERQLSRLAEREARLHAQMAEQATDHEAVQALDAQLREVSAEREQLEEQWLTAAELVG
jgi:ABC-type multidrug transport system ATPase subunit